MPIRTINIDTLTDQVGSIFEAVAILGKRSRQISSRAKAELDEKLSYYEGFETEIEDPRFQEEQSRISLEYEVKPKATEVAIKEMLSDEIYFRDPTEDEEAVF